MAESSPFLLPPQPVGDKLIIAFRGKFTIGSISLFLPQTMDIGMDGEGEEARVKSRGQKKRRKRRRNDGLLTGPFLPSFSSVLSYCSCSFLSPFSVLSVCPAAHSSSSSVFVQLFRPCQQDQTPQEEGEKLASRFFFLGEGRKREKKKKEKPDAYFPLERTTCGVPLPSSLSLSACAVKEGTGYFQEREGKTEKISQHRCERHFAIGGELSLFLLPFF